MSTISFANEIHTLSDEPPVSDEMVPYGATPPSTNSVHDLSKSDYNYNVESIGAKLYTDKRFKNVSSIFVYVNDFAHEGGSTDIHHQVLLEN